MKKLPKVIIIGRANVGKSTLFNRLIEKPKALTSVLAGTTRDINTGVVYWQGINFELQDTGGIETIIAKKKLKNLSPELNIDFAIDIIKNTQAALKEADLILFVVDIKAGLLPQDKDLSQAIKKIKKKIIFVANKTDSMKQRDKIADFFKLGLDEPVFVSAINGSGTGDLLDEVTKNLKKITKVRRGNKYEVKDPINVSIIGKPNVGKSSLLNAILKEKRAIISPLAFTTREAIDCLVEYKKKNFIIIDTAGIRRKSKINKGLEKISVTKSMINIRKSSICFFVIDISEPISTQDNKLSKILIDSQVSIIMIANKWDKIKNKETNSQKEYEEKIYKNFPYLKWVPIFFTSAKTGQHTHKIMDLALKIHEIRQIKLNDNALDKFLKKAIKKHRPTRAKGTKHPYIKKLTQVKTNPPRFEVVIGKNDSLHDAYVKYLENSLRIKFGLIGTPLKIGVKK